MAFIGPASYSHVNTDFQEQTML